MGNNHKTDKIDKNDGVILETKLEHMQYSYGLVNAWIENADNKVSVACAVFAGVFAVVTSLSEKIEESCYVNACLEMIYGVAFLLSIAGLLVAAFCYVKALNPNLLSVQKKKKNTPRNKKYPLYFGDVASIELDEYKTLMGVGTENDFISELIDETYHNAGVCKTKMNWYKRGLWISFFAILFSTVSLGAHYFMYR